MIMLHLTLCAVAAVGVGSEGSGGDPLSTAHFAMPPPALPQLPGAGAPGR